MCGLPAGIEQFPIEHGEGLRRMAGGAGCAAAEALDGVAVASAKRQTKARRHDRGRDAVQIRKFGAGMVHPLNLVLLQFQGSRGETGDRVDPRVHGAIGLDQEVGRDRSEAEGGNGSNAQRQAQLQVGLRALPHRRTSLADDLVFRHLTAERNRRKAPRTIPGQCREIFPAVAGTREAAGRATPA